MTPEQRTHAIVHNAADRALSSHGFWVPLRVRTAIAETVLAALAEHGLIVVARQDLAETVEDAHAYDVEYRIDLDRPSAGARLDRLRAALPDVAAQPSGTLQDEQATGLGISGRSDDQQGVASLSALREELRRMVLARNAANAMRGVHEHRAARLKTELDHAKAALAGDSDAIRLFMLDCTRTAERRREQADLWQKAAEQAEVKLDRLREPHTRGPRTNTCNDCGQDWPCETIQTIDEEKPRG